MIEVWICIQKLEFVLVQAAVFLAVVEQVNFNITDLLGQHPRVNVQPIRKHLIFAHVCTPFVLFFHYRYCSKHKGRCKDSDSEMPSVFSHPSKTLLRLHMTVAIIYLHNSHGVSLV